MGHFSPPVTVQEQVDNKHFPLLQRIFVPGSLNDHGIFLEIFFLNYVYVCVSVSVYVSTVLLKSRRGRQILVELELLVIVNYMTWFMSCWELNSGPVQEQEELLTAVSSVRCSNWLGSVFFILLCWTLRRVVQTSSSSW